MSSRTRKSIIQSTIRSLKSDHKNGFDLAGSSQSYSRGKSYEYMITVDVLDKDYTKFCVYIVEYGGKLQRAMDRHYTGHYDRGDKTFKTSPNLNEKGEIVSYTMLDCCENKPSIGPARIVYMKPRFK